MTRAVLVGLLVALAPAGCRWSRSADHVERVRQREAELERHPGYDPPRTPGELAERYANEATDQRRSGR
jgi:hypothetical protein